MSSTIFALASGVGRAGVAVWRLSGPKTAVILTALMGKIPTPRFASYTSLKTPQGVLIDKGLVLWFPGPASFTGEDMAELQIHGGRALAQLLSTTLIALGALPAQAGDFTRRAVLNGKLDLTQAESLIDLVDAATERQRVQALATAQGTLARLVQDWRSRLIKAAGYLEATIDFAEEDIPPNLLLKVNVAVFQIAQEMTQSLQQAIKGERLREGFTVAILGAPNAGKSSLLNAIAGRDVAIVSHLAGTTRDVIEVELEMAGWPVILCDTAGLRETEDVIEQEGIKRALSRAEQADLKIVVFDGSNLDPDSVALLDERSVVVVNKMDQAVELPQDVAGYAYHQVSALTGSGIDSLLETLESLAESSMSGPGAMFSRWRHRAALEEAVTALGRFSLEAGVELAAEELRLAAHAIGRISGIIVADDVLDVVFREFCIGK